MPFQMAEDDLHLLATRVKLSNIKVMEYLLLAVLGAITSFFILQVLGRQNLYSNGLIIFTHA